MFTDFKPKFTKRYAKLTEVAVAGIAQYVKEVKEGSFPNDAESFHGTSEEELKRLYGQPEEGGAVVVEMSKAQ